VRYPRFLRVLEYALAGEPPIMEALFFLRNFSFLSDVSELPAGRLAGMNVSSVFVSLRVSLV